MKKIILIFVLISCLKGYSQEDFHKREIISEDGIAIFYDNQRLYIDIKNSAPVNFEIRKNNQMVLNAKGIAKGNEFFPVSKGKYKFILFDKDGKSKTKIFHL